MSIFFNCNGKLYREGTPVLRADNRSFRYGDGLFETMRVTRGKIIRSTLHFERLFNSLGILRYTLPETFTPAYLKDEILSLVQANKHFEGARVRLTMYRGNGNLYNQEDSQPGFVIQSWPLEPFAGEWSEHGLSLGIYPDAKKSCDKFSQLKTNNFLGYAMAANFAEENKFNDVVLLNTSGRVCDTTIANIFIVEDKQIFTPPLAEGCVAGTFRKFLLRELPAMGVEIIEKPITVQELKNADEIFLTNAMQQIKWVEHLGGKEFRYEEAFKIYSFLQPTI